MLPHIIRPTLKIERLANGHLSIEGKNPDDVVIPEWESRKLGDRFRVQNPNYRDRKEAKIVVISPLEGETIRVINTGEGFSTLDIATVGQFRLTLERRPQGDRVVVAEDW